MEPISLFQAARSMQSLTKFVDDGGLTVALADIGQKAAEEILQKLHLARDKRSQITVAIGLLKQAEVALGRDMEQRKPLYEGLRPVHLVNLLLKRRYVLCLMAMCYLYTGEISLARDAIIQADRLEQNIGDQSAIQMLSTGGVFETVAVAFLPTTYLDLRARYSSNGKRLKSFWDGFHLLKDDILSLTDNSLSSK